jgi:hypothetical protein
MTLFDTRLGKLDEMLADGASFGKIEDWIDDQPMDDESKAALWLAAWSEQPRAQRREMVAPGRYGSVWHPSRSPTPTGRPA